MARMVRNPFTGEDVDLTDWDAQAQPKAPATPATPAPQVQGAPTWGNQGGTPQSDPYTNYTNPPEAPRAALPPPPPTTAPAPSQGYQPAIDKLWSTATGSGRSDNTFTPDALAQLLQDPQFAGFSMVPGSRDKVRMPNGQIVDVIGDEGGANQGSWTISGGQQGENGQGVNWGGGSGGGGGYGGSASSMSSSTTGPSGAYKTDDLMYQQILKLLERGNKPVTEEDMASQFEPVSRQFQRGGQKAREAAAERMAYSGTNLGGAGGALDAEVNSINEQVGEKQGLAMAQLMTQELSARRQDVQNAMQFAQGEEKMALQMQLAQIDKELRQQSLALEGQGLNLQGQQLGQQDRQFYDRLAFDYGSANNNSDDELAQLLGL